eukprot:5600961-Amphidinium_carterae.2
MCQVSSDVDVLALAAPISTAEQDATALLFQEARVKYNDDAGFVPTDAMQLKPPFDALSMLYRRRAWVQD